MVRLYLDIETYGDAFTDGKIILVGSLEDWTSYEERSLEITSGPNVEYWSFSEWELGSEQQVIERFYDYLYDLMEEARFLVVIGYNILRFDIPLLIQKGAKYGINSIENLNKLWHELLIIDLFQVTLPLNNMKLKGHSFENLVKLAEELGLKIPDKPYGTGKDVQKWYEERRYEDIEKHNEIDLRITRALDLQISRFLRSYVERQLSQKPGSTKS